MELKDRMARAEDYVFGLMNEQERERAERDMEVDAEFRDCVMILAERLRKLHRAKGPAPMSDEAWNEITARIAQMPQMAAAGWAAAGLPSPDPDRKGFLRVKRPFAHQFGGWRGTVVAVALAAAMLAGWLGGQATAPAPQPVAVAILNDSDGAAIAIVEVYGDDRVRLLPLEAIEVPAGKVLLLWTRGEAGPIPLGASGRAAEVTLQGPELADPRPGQLYEITLEEAGAVTARPAGPVVAAGEAVHPPR